jgi:hypothetical protein
LTDTHNTDSVTPVKQKGPIKAPETKRIKQMPRKPKDTNADPENFYALENTTEVEEFIESYTNQGLDSYRSAYSDSDYDTDNYGYSDY